MPNDTCKFLDHVKRKQHQVWLTLLFWCIGVVTFLALSSAFFEHASKTVLQIVVYGSVFVLYVPAFALFRLKCPYCNRPAGALPFVRYKSLRCRKCGERVECGQHAQPEH
jgi:hypothetical protein